MQRGADGNGPAPGHHLGSKPLVAGADLAVVANFAAVANLADLAAVADLAVVAALAAMPRGVHLHKK